MQRRASGVAAFWPRVLALAALVIALGACQLDLRGFSLRDASPGRDVPSRLDGSISDGGDHVDLGTDASQTNLPGPIAHLPSDQWFTYPRDVALAGAAAIDTDALSLSEGGTKIADLELTMAVSGNEVALLRLRTLQLDKAARLVARGARPVLILASGSITVRGTIDVGAQGALPGAGAMSSGAGTGGDGEGGSPHNAGGGGGGFGTRGGAGGSAGPTAGVAAGVQGEIHGDAELSLLRGGSRGGAAGGSAQGACERPGGGGGGALQLYSAFSIAVEFGGWILAGGGGGTGGGCADPTWPGSGGGGSGGAIYLQSSSVRIKGGLSANGGGGGSLAESGQDGSAAAIAESNAFRAAAGGKWSDDGSATGSVGAPGATGASKAFSAGPGFSGGGGGGGVGRIVIDTAELESNGQVSPAAFQP